MCSHCISFPRWIWRHTIVKICISPRSLKQWQRWPQFMLSASKQGVLCKNMTRLVAVNYYFTDRPRMMNGSASVSNCISILCACIANKEESEWERAFFLGLSGCLCFSVGHVRRKRLAGEEYTYTDKLHNNPAGHSERGCFFILAPCQSFYQSMLIKR